MTRVNWCIVDRYLAGEATAQEQLIVEHWLADSPAFRMFLTELYRGALDDQAVHQAAADVRARLERLEREVAPARRPSRYEVTRSRGTSLPSVRARLPRRTRELKRAAAVALLLSSSLLVWRSVGRANEHYTATTPGTIIAPISHPPVSGALPDRSRMTLSPGSTVRRTTNLTHRREVGIDKAVVTPSQLGRPAADGTPIVESADTVSSFSARGEPEES